MISQNHMAEIGVTLSQYRQQNFLCDTVLCADDKQLKAHSILLAAVSPVFKSVFETSGSAGLYNIDLPGIDSEDLEVALHFIYTGTLLLPSCYSLPGELSKLFATMQLLGLDPQRFDGCEMKFMSSADESNEPDDGDSKTEETFMKSDFSSEVDTEQTIEIRDKKSDEYSGISEDRLCSADEKSDAGCVVAPQELIIAEPDDTKFVQVKAEFDQCADSESGMVVLERSSSNDNLDTKPEPVVPGETSYGGIPGETSLESSWNEQTIQNHKVLLIQLPSGGGDAEVVPKKISSVLAEVAKKRHACPTCNKVFVSNAILEQHQLVHTGEKPHTCTFCKKSFSMKSNLERHEKRHTGIRPHLCELCGKGFIQKTALQYHIKSHREEMKTEDFKQGEVYTCSTCGLAFNRGANLRKHVQKVHAKSEDYIDQNNSRVLEKKSLLCDLCGKGFASVNSLKLHKMQHTGEKPFVCMDCGKAFVVKAQLQYHARLHTGEKPFVCQTCGKGFVGKLGLTQHVRTHTGERPYICTLCGKGFTQSTHLKGHMRSHTGEKPNICHLCGKAYKNRLDLRFHYSRIHEMNITRPKQHVVKVEQS